MGDREDECPHLFNAVVLACFLILLLLGDWKDALFGFAAIGNSVIGVIQELRAKRLLDRLAVVSAPRARVRRGDEVIEVPRQELVMDDIMMLRAGDQLTADAEVLSAERLEVDESLLTGESEPVPKQLGMRMLSGSHVVSGHGEARVVGVGANAFANRIAAQAKRFSMMDSELRRGIDRVLKWVTVALLPVLIVVLNGQIQAAGGWEVALTSGAWRDSASGAIASVIAMIPLGLVLLVSIAFTVGAVRLARQQVLIQELAAVEVLARVDILCLDKTGTLTEGGIAFDAVHEVGTPPDGWDDILGWFGADPNANATARCLAEAFPCADGLRPSAQVEFSSARKWSAVGFSAAPAGTWVLGNPLIVLPESSDIASGALSTATALASTGLRTLVLAHTKDVLSAPARSAPDLPHGLVPVALLTFREQVRQDARRTLEFFREEGVGIKVISGDSPETVAAIARDVGLDVEYAYDAHLLPGTLLMSSDCGADLISFRGGCGQIMGKSELIP